MKHQKRETEWRNKPLHNFTKVQQYQNMDGTRVRGSGCGCDTETLPQYKQLYIFISLESPLLLFLITYCLAHLFDHDFDSANVWGSFLVSTINYRRNIIIFMSGLWVWSGIVIASGKWTKLLLQKCGFFRKLEQQPLKLMISLKIPAWYRFLC